MPFIPHTVEEVEIMLSEIGADNIDQLFDEIPEAIRNRSLDGIGPGISEMEMLRLMKGRAQANSSQICFLGAGALVVAPAAAALIWVSQKDALSR